MTCGFVNYRIVFCDSYGLTGLGGEEIFGGGGGGKRQEVKVLPQFLSYFSAPWASSLTSFFPLLPLLRLLLTTPALACLYKELTNCCVEIALYPKDNFLWKSYLNKVKVSDLGRSNQQIICRLKTK